MSSDEERAAKDSKHLCSSLITQEENELLCVVCSSLITQGKSELLYIVCSSLTTQE
jgi:hypothetical protein